MCLRPIGVDRQSAHRKKIAKSNCKCQPLIDGINGSGDDDEIVSYLIVIYSFGLFFLIVCYMDYKQLLVVL